MLKQNQAYIHYLRTVIVNGNNVLIGRKSDGTNRWEFPGILIAPDLDKGSHVSTLEKRIGLRSCCVEPVDRFSRNMSRKDLNGSISLEIETNFEIMKTDSQVPILSSRQYPEFDWVSIESLPYADLKTDQSHLEVFEALVDRI